MKVQQDENKHSWRIGHLPRGRCVYPLTQSMSLEWPRVIMLQTDGPFKLNLDPFDRFFTESDRCCGIERVWLARLRAKAS